MTIDHSRRMARKGVFVAQRGSFKACAPGHDSIPQLGPCRALLGLPVCNPLEVQSESHECNG